MERYFVCMLLGCLLCVAAAEAATTADILFVVDESGSMEGAHNWLEGMIVNFDQELRNAGITSNRYALVGYGSYDYEGHFDPHKHNSWMTPSGFKTEVGRLVSNGAEEDGYNAIHYALNNYSFRSASNADAALNIILVTDEDRDKLNRSLTYGSMLTELEQFNAMLNVVVDVNYGSFGTGVEGALGVDYQGVAYLPDGSGNYVTSTDTRYRAIQQDGIGNKTTANDYIKLAWDTGGAGWDLSQMVASDSLLNDSFSRAFIDIKVKEIVGDDDDGDDDPNPDPDPDPDPVVVPVPGTMLLSALGVGLVGYLRRRTMI